MKKAGVVEPAVTNWALPTVFVAKKDRRLCFPVDYRRVNDFTVFDAYLIARMHECIDSPREVEMFSTLDANLGY